MPSVLIGMAGGDSLRFSQFVIAMQGLRKPEQCSFLQSLGFSVAQNWNLIARKFLEHQNKFDYLFLVEDDNLLPPHALMQLLSHDLDIVSGFYLQRRIPFPPMMFERVDENGKVYHRMLQKEDKGLIEVEATGGGCLLIRRNVIETMKDPWWFYGNCIEQDTNNHDINFCREARKLGFKVFVDLELPIIHMGYMPVIPHRKPDGTWVTLIDQGGPDRTIEVGAATK